MVTVAALPRRTWWGHLGVEVLRLRMVNDERVRGLLGMQLQLLAQGDPDPLGPEQVNQEARCSRSGQAG